MFQLEIQPTNKMAGTGAREKWWSRWWERKIWGRTRGNEKEMKGREKVKILGIRWKAHTRKHMHTLNTFAGCSHKIIMFESERERDECVWGIVTKKCVNFSPFSYKILFQYDIILFSPIFQFVLILPDSCSVFFWFSLATKLKFIGLPFRIGCFLTVSCDDGMTKTTNRKERTNECEAEAGSKNKRRNKNFCDNHLLHLLRFWEWFYSFSLCVLIALDRLCTEKCIRTNKPINHVKQKLLLNAIWCKQMKFNDAWCIFIRIRIQEHT